MYDIVYNYVSMIYSVTEASYKLGISDAHCRRLLKSGKIKGKKLGHDWVVLRLDYKRKRKPKEVKGNDKSRE
jgi:excisionase family DNA binding protein